VHENIAGGGEPPKSEFSGKWPLKHQMMCFICCQVVDGSVPLAGVLLSLSGSGNYRQNNVTPDSGIMQFTSLVRLILCLLLNVSHIVSGLSWFQPG